MHLFHPALVHFSVAFLIVGGLCEAWGLWTGRERPARFGAALVVLGTLSVVPTIVTGYLAANSVELTKEAFALVETHEANGWFLLGVFVAAVFWKGWYRGQVPPAQRRLLAVLLLAGVALAASSAWLGGKLVYRHGVGVQQSGAADRSGG